MYSDEAEYRDNHLKSVSYKLLIELCENEYKGSIEISFFLKKIPDKNLWLDFQGLEISNILLNGNNNNSLKFEKHRIYFPTEGLLISRNTIRMNFKNSYVNNSAGLHYYKENDGNVYIFSHLEPFFCHRFFPCFD